MTSTHPDHGPPDYDLEAYRRFRAEREAELVEPYGWLTLHGFHWLPESPAPLPDLPGRWSATADEASVEAKADDGLVLEGSPLDGRSTMTVGEAGRVPWVTLGDTEVELLRRGGRFAIRMRAATSTDREGFQGVPTYDVDPAWSLSARFIPYGDERLTEVTTFRPDLVQRVKAVGVVEFTAGGEPQRLVVTSMKYGLGVEFHDPTNGTETEAWRQLRFDQPGPDGRVVLDFNRAINMWFAFTPYATCPAPTSGNTVTVPVRAGERKVS